MRLVQKGKTKAIPFICEKLNFVKFRGRGRALMKFFQGRGIFKGTNNYIDRRKECKKGAIDFAKKLEYLYGGGGAFI